MLLFVSLTAISGFQMYSQRQENVKRHWISAQNGPGIEFQVDQERGQPFVSKPDGGGGDDEDPRGFNNPNIVLQVKFKNKIKNNQYEFMVTIQPENSLSSEEAKASGFFKQYKVKRSLQEF